MGWQSKNFFDRHLIKKKNLKKKKAMSPPTISSPLRFQKLHRTQWRLRLWLKQMTLKCSPPLRAVAKLNREKCNTRPFYCLSQPRLSRKCPPTHIQGLLFIILSVVNLLKPRSNHTHTFHIQVATTQKFHFKCMPHILGFLITYITQLIVPVPVEKSYCKLWLKTILEGNVLYILNLF